MIVFIKHLKRGRIMKSITKKIESIYAAVAFAESGEFELAKHIMDEFYSEKIQHSHEIETRLQRL